MPARTHRTIALGALVLLAATAAALPSNDAESAAAAAPHGKLKPPNIVVIQADDETYAQLNDEAMPNTERLLVKRGTNFTNYIATTAQCCPSRASFFTGQYAHNHGVTSNRLGYTGLVDKGNVLPVWLRRAGYNTIHVGKFMNRYEQFAKPETSPAPGWDEWRSVLSEGTRYYDYDYFVNGRVVHRGSAPEDNLTTVLNHDAVRMVHRYAPEPKPFYLQLDERAPHVSGTFDPHGSCGHAAMPEPQDERRFKGSLPRPPSFNEKGMGDKPAFLRSKPRLNQEARHKVRHRWNCSLDAVAGVDRGVKKVFDAVREAGDMKRTVFVFLSDNGFFFGEHRITSGKVLPYEEALHLPLVIRIPRRYRDGAPRVAQTSEPTANIDLAPTLVQLAGAAPCTPSGCRTMDGRSLVPLLDDTGQWPAHRSLLTEYNEPGLSRHSTCEFAGIRQDDQVYVEHYRVVQGPSGGCVGENPPEVERYDLRNDPYELDNLCAGGLVANCPTTPRQLLLDRELARLKDCAGIKGRDQQVDGRPFCD
jgi:arylsulfatase A-like enzyme